MAAVAPLRAQRAALQSAYSRLQSELGELQQLDAALASNEQALKGAMVEADRVMEDARRRKAPDVDDVLVAPTIVGGQLYTLAAEEKGIADALFILGRALGKGRVSIDVFVKVSASLPMCLRRRAARRKGMEALAMLNATKTSSIRRRRSCWEVHLIRI
jgi:ESCRT-I complex subunit TSG101